MRPFMAFMSTDHLTSSVNQCDGLFSVVIARVILRSFNSCPIDWLHGLTDHL